MGAIIHFTGGASVEVDEEPEQVTQVVGRIQVTSPTGFIELKPGVFVNPETVTHITKAPGD